MIQKCMHEIQNKWWLRKVEEVQFATDFKKSKLFDQTIKEIYAQQQSICTLHKSKDDNTPLTQSEDIQAR